MAETVDVLCEDRRWKAVGLDALAERACAVTLGFLGLDPARFDISLLGCDDARIAALNRDFRETDAPTNVLSWPSAEHAPARPGAHPALPRPAADGPTLALGDIAISLDTCAREAEAAGRPMAFHVTHLLVHATLHLLGYDHIFHEDASLMEDLERRILASMGLPDPYE